MTKHWCSLVFGLVGLGDGAASAFGPPRPRVPDGGARRCGLGEVVVRCPQAALRRPRRGPRRRAAARVVVVVVMVKVLVVRVASRQPLPGLPRLPRRALVVAVEAVGAVLHVRPVAGGAKQAALGGRSLHGGLHHRLSRHLRARGVAPGPRAGRGSAVARTWAHRGTCRRRPHPRRRRKRGCGASTGGLGGVARVRGGK